MEYCHVPLAVAADTTAIPWTELGSGSVTAVPSKLETSAPVEFVTSSLIAGKVGEGLVLSTGATFANSDTELLVSLASRIVPCDNPEVGWSIHALRYLAVAG